MIAPVSYGAYVVGADALHPALHNLQYPGFMEECDKFGKNDCRRIYSIVRAGVICFRARRSALFFDIPRQTFRTVFENIGKNNSGKKIP